MIENGVASRGHIWSQPRLKGMVLHAHELHQRQASSTLRANSLCSKDHQQELEHVEVAKP